MLFNSWEFIILFLITATLYFNMSYTYGITVLLISSYLFYIYWRWDFALIMLGVSLVNYFCGIKIVNTKNIKLRKLWLWLSIILSVMPLLYFKYANFFLENANFFLHSVDQSYSFSYLQLVLPVGISFFTFQALSYTLDVYFGKTKVEKNIVRFCTFVAFFPQLIAGPIERSSNLLQQLKNKYSFKNENFIDGAKLFIWGLFKKVVIADRLALFVDKIYEYPEPYATPTLILATVFFAFQIYCDFSGYSDMAIGVARILGFKLMQNFNLPYLASSISDFWKRWHISLSTWFGDYVYKPLGGSRVKYTKWLRNILIVFLVSGFWHGAKWTFIVWGLLHAFLYFFESWGDLLLDKLNLKRIKEMTVYKVLKIISVFIFVCFAWVFFRANSLPDAFLISKRILTNWDGNLFLGSSTVGFVLSCFLVLLLVVVQIFQYKGISSIYFRESKVPQSFQLMWYVALLIGISLLGLSSNSFIYFQF